MVSASSPHRVAVVGAGITGLSAADRLGQRDSHRQRAPMITVFDAAERVGGRIAASPFAGLAAIDEAADAFLIRIPHALELAVTVGVDVDLVHPQPVGAAVWHHGLHRIPDGTVLGVPGRLGPIVRSQLLSWRAKLRAAAEPLVPRQSLSPDSLGGFVRARFGDEVHERLVDALVGSIYATDTDRFSLAEVPQLYALASAHRSMLIGARRTRDVASTGPIFAAPKDGVAALTAAAERRFVARGGVVRLGERVDDVSPTVGGGWSVDGEPFDAVILTTPAAVSARLLESAAPDSATLLATAETADVVLVTLHVAADQWPDRLRGMSGYLVPKPVQRWVTAVSFGSQKWAHWRPPGGGEILRVSLGRDGQPVLHLSDEELLDGVLTDLERHLGIAFDPLEVRISRWPGAFAQYRPHHAAWAGAVDRGLPPGIFVAGASYRGIGVPACVRQGRTIAERATQHLDRLAD